MKFWSIDSFLDEKFEVGPCLVEPFYPSHGIGLLHGRQTSGKTQLALTLARAITSGSLFLDQFKCEHGPVAYFQVDMPEPLLQDRFRQAPELWRGLPLYMFCHPNRINIFNVNSDPTIKAALETAQQYKPVLTIVDSLRKVHQLEENSSDSATKVYGAWKDYLPDSAILFLHHENKPQQGVSYRPPEDKPRGNSAWLDDADCGMGLTRTGKHDGNGHMADLVWTKQRAGAQQAVEKMNLVMDDETLLMRAGDLTPKQCGYLFLEEAGWEASQKEFSDHLVKTAKISDRQARRIYQKLTEEKGLDMG